ncbi:ribosome-recycling factor, mitochondrial isoform X2 [Macrobrachium rosenbergii]|uniref:ribosome-recycling factor, mitochondrial isoform X2 n=1 Tax=Macrobrachium rosenbergii TaxID=79674 RepID=UPI0034D64785
MFWLRSATVSRMYSFQVSSYLSRMLGCLPASSLSQGENRQLSVLSKHEPNITRAFPGITFQCQVRSYAKGKDKKGKGGIETLPVELEGDKYPLNEVAQVSRKSPQMLIINAASFPQATVGIIKAIRESGMNLNPQQEGTTIYVPVPKVTKEHRENLAKSAKTLCNRCKDQLRERQNNFIRKVRTKEGQVSEDLVYNVQLKIREIADDHMQEAEKLMAAKQKELLKTSS